MPHIPLRIRFNLDKDRMEPFEAAVLRIDLCGAHLSAEDRRDLAHFVEDLVTEVQDLRSKIHLLQHGVSPDALHLQEYNSSSMSKKELDK